MRGWHGRRPGRGVLRSRSRASSRAHHRYRVNQINEAHEGLATANGPAPTPSRPPALKQREGSEPGIARRLRSALWLVLLLARHTVTHGRWSGWVGRRAIRGRYNLRTSLIRLMRQLLRPWDDARERDRRTTHPGRRPRRPASARKRSLTRSPLRVRRFPGAEVPVQAGHHGQAFAQQFRRQVLVGRVLRTARVGVRHPDRAQAEHVGEDVVGQ